MAAYLIYQAEVLDPDQYAKYREKSTPAVKAGGGEFLVRGGEVDHLEGDPPLGRTVVVRFESMAAARAWYDGELYSEARAVRQGAVNANAYFVDGVD
ncbi:MAG: DUF1330 domain-containing protein [Acidimicrobiales bacterium]